MHIFNCLGTRLRKVAPINVRVGIAELVRQGSVCLIDDIKNFSECQNLKILSHGPITWTFNDFINLHFQQCIAI